MNMFIVFFQISSFLVSDLVAQQIYSGNSVMDCTSEQSTADLYSCNGNQSSCRALLIFRAQPNYANVFTIAKLLSSNPEELARVNSISDSIIFHQDQEVIVPVNCSCSGARRYYQANTTYTINSYDNYFTVANYTYQGLTTCKALSTQNPYNATSLEVGLDLQVPLRCACPTTNQSKNGSEFLLSYLVTMGDYIESIGRKFNVSESAILDANLLLETDEIYPFTTILVPLKEEPRVLPLPKSLDKKGKTYDRIIFIGVAVGSCLAIVCFILFVCVCKGIGKEKVICFWKSKTSRRKWKLSVSILDGIAKLDQILKIYTFEELEIATNNFNPIKRIGGSVYKGVLRGKVLAIKRMNSDAVEETRILSKIYHFNVIHLHGLCEHSQEIYLVYEFMENGSLKQWLQRENDEESQSWNSRIVIALDVANGLDYLHNFTTPGYVHKRLITNNILLDKDLRAKIACFSHARSAEIVEDSFPSASCILGAKGYLAPEYLETGEVTSKLDVYAYGVVLLELVTGREAVYQMVDKEVLLSDTILPIMQGSCVNEELPKLIDPRLQLKHPMGYVIDQSQVALRLIKLSIACLERDPARRLSMADVVSNLLKIQLDV
ncbi:transmembrane signal receptor [Lithospermum erythrorhizon]|uniref:Transmembrane signal receptor n=1 Tax=Lithospermum erythrorhizon TaxID=34254 RepID=A0AAV3S2G1_LITER